MGERKCRRILGVNRHLLPFSVLVVLPCEPGSYLYIYIKLEIGTASDADASRHFQYSYKDAFRLFNERSRRHRNLSAASLGRVPSMFPGVRSIKGRRAEGPWRRLLVNDGIEIGKTRTCFTHLALARADAEQGGYASPSVFSDHTRFFSSSRICLRSLVRASVPAE